MSYEADVKLEDKISVEIGTLKYYAICRVERVYELLMLPDFSINYLRRVVSLMVNSLERLDSRLFLELGKYIMRTQMTKSIEETVEMKNEQIKTLNNEISKAYPSKDRSRDLIKRVIYELDMYFQLVDSFLYLRGKYGTITEVVEDGTQNKFEDEPEHEHEHEIKGQQQFEEAEETISPFKIIGNETFIEHKKKEYINRLIEENQALRINYLLVLYEQMYEQLKEDDSAEEDYVPWVMASNLSYLFNSDRERYIIEEEMHHNSVLDVTKRETDGARMVIIPEHAIYLVRSLVQQCRGIEESEEDTPEENY